MENVSFDPSNVQITRRSARKSEQMKNFWGIKICLYLTFKTKIRSTMLCVSGFELYSRWVPLNFRANPLFKTLGDANSVPSRHIKRDEASLPVDVFRLFSC